MSLVALSKALLMFYVVVMLLKFSNLRELVMLYCMYLVAGSDTLLFRCDAMLPSSFLILMLTEQQGDLY